MNGGVKLNLITHGEGAHVVLLHGLAFPGTMMWKRWWPTLVHKGYRVTLLDFPGHGGSNVADFEYNLADVTRWTHIALMNAGITEAHYVGTSLGGMVALRLARDYPQHVRSMVLIGTSAKREPDRTKERYLELAATVRHVWKPTEEQRRSALVSTLLPIFFSTGDEDILGFWRTHLLTQMKSQEACAGLYRAAWTTFTRKGIPHQVLESLDTPAYVMRGADDIARSLEESQHLVDNLPRVFGMKVLELEGLGHMCVIENPMRTVSEVLTFLSTLS